MTYSATIDCSPAYELLCSLLAFTQKSTRRGLALGDTWLRAIRAKLGPELADRLERNDILANGKVGAFGIDLLIHQYPGERTAEGFVGWLASRPVGELYERLADEVQPLPDRLGDARDQIVEALGTWNERYFRETAPNILLGLERHAKELRSRSAQTSSVELFEVATNGIRQAPTPALQQVILVPQYHLNPYVTSFHHRTTIICMYPVDATPSQPGNPPSSLLRVTRCLADEGRLRIMWFLARQQRSFAEIVSFTGLAKSTVHYHLAELRSAGLIRIHAAGPTVEGYTLRREGLAPLLPALDQFLSAE